MYGDSLSYRHISPTFPVRRRSPTLNNKVILCSSLGYAMGSVGSGDQRTFQHGTVKAVLVEAQFQ